MEYAIVESAGRQFKVTSGQLIEIDGEASEKNSLTFDKVLLYVTGEGDVNIGKPYLTNVSVQAKVVSAGLGKKIRVARFTAKSRHRRVVGFRPKKVQVQIEKIVAKEAAVSTKTKQK